MRACTHTHTLWQMKLVIFSPLLYAGKWLLRCRWLADSGLQWGMYTYVTFLVLTRQCYMNRWVIWGRCYICMLFCLGFGLLMCNIKICTVCAVVTFVYKAWDCDCLLFLSSGTSGTWSISFFPHGSTASSGPRLPYCRGFGSHSDTTFGRTFLDEWSACRRDVCLTTHNPHKRETSVPLAGFEPAIPAEWPQTHSVDHTATEIGLD